MAPDADHHVATPARSVVRHILDVCPVTLAFLGRPAAVAPVGVRLGTDRDVAIAVGQVSRERRPGVQRVIIVRGVDHNL